jgi:hypothetical protein
MEADNEVGNVLRNSCTQVSARLGHYTMARTRSTRSKRGGSLPRRSERRGRAERNEKKREETLLIPRVQSQPSRSKASEKQKDGDGHLSQLLSEDLRTNEGEVWFLFQFRNIASISL